MIRPFQAGDESAVVGVWHRAGRAAYPFLPTWQAFTFEHARRVFQNVIRPKCEIWVGARGELVVAYLALTGSCIDRLYVDPPEWRKGWGTRLITLAKERSPRGLELHTHQENHAARAFYEKHGFQAVRFGVSPAPESAPDVEYHWRPSRTDAGPASVGAETLLFLPGASGDTRFWQPVGGRLTHPGERRYLAWPGFGGVPADPAVRGIGDLVARVVAQITGPVALLAQSMGGVIAVRAALERPDLVRRLVLSVTSGGLDVAGLGARDWRPAFRAHNPQVPAWFLDEREDLSERMRGIAIPVLLLWGDADPISPVTVGRRLAEILPRAELIVIEGGTHDLVRERAGEIAPHIDRHLAG